VNEPINESHIASGIKKGSQAIMNPNDLPAEATVCKARLVQAEARIEQAEARTEQARTRTEQAETRIEQAETRTEQAKTRADQAEVRTEQAERALQREVQKDVQLPEATSSRQLGNITAHETANPKGPLEQLTSRQREILQLIAEGQNTKQIAELLKVSTKTVEYHRMKLMAGLNLHDVPGLVRYAMRVGLITPDR
jgi:DNA-binding CsgD family transcriptional regulator